MGRSTSSESDDSVSSRRHRHRSSRKKRRRNLSSGSSLSCSSSSSDDSRSRRRRKRSNSRSSSWRKRKTRNKSRSRERSRRSQSRSRRRSSSRDRRDTTVSKKEKRRRRRSRSRSRSTAKTRRSHHSRSSSSESRCSHGTDKRRDDRRLDNKEAKTAAALTESLRINTALKAVEEALLIGEAERSKDIERINSIGFQQQTFVSKKSQHLNPEVSDVACDGDAHMAAMFGTTSLEEFLAAQARKPPKLTDYRETPELLLHPSICEDGGRRLEKWKKKLQTERRKLTIAQSVPPVTPG